MGEVTLMGEEIENVSNHLKTNKLAVVNVSATWCGPCRALAPHFNKLAQDNSHIAFCKVDVDDIHPQDLHDKVEGISTRVRSIPAYLICKDGQEIACYPGKEFEKFAAAIKELGASEE